MNISINKAGAARSAKRVFLSRATVLTVTMMLALLIAGVLSTAWAAPPDSPKAKHSWLQSGLATWYGKQFHGHRTASGERFDMHAFTAAHRSLPLGSWIRVTNVTNQKSVLVRINDRGPMSQKYVLDLSFGAAQAIGISGFANVRIDQLKKDDPEVLLASAPRPILLPGSLSPLERGAANSNGVPQLDAAIASR